jgi:hypothetical protein
MHRAQRIEIYTYSGFGEKDSRKRNSEKVITEPNLKGQQSI